MAINAYIAIQTLVSNAPADTFKEWNFIHSTAEDHSVALDDDSDVSTGWTLTVGANGAEGEGTDGVDDVGTGDAAWVDEAIISDNYQFMTTQGQVADYDFTGLNDSKTYKIEVFGSRTSAGDRIGEWSIDGFSNVFGEIDCVDNSMITVFASGVSPVSGLITLSFRHKSGEANAYLNAIWIQEEDSAAITTIIIVPTGPPLS